jgi:hypothetical protein
MIDNKGYDVRMTREVKDQIPYVQDIWLSKQDQCMDRRGQGTYMILMMQ